VNSIAAISGMRFEHSCTARIDLGHCSDMAIGIGATTSISVSSTPVILSPLPFREARTSGSHLGGEQRRPLSSRQIEFHLRSSRLVFDWRAQSASFESTRLTPGAR